MVNGWKQVPISEIGNILSGGTPSTKITSYWDGHIAWCMPSDITDQNSKFMSDTERKITQLGLDNSSATLLPKGTILLCSRATIGEMALAASEITTNQGFKNIICFDRYDNEFVYYALHEVKQEMISKAFGSTFLEISKKELGEINLQVPEDKVEQREIATALSDIDELIANLEKLIAKKTAIKQGVMQQLMTGKKRLPGFSKKWEYLPFEECFDILNNNTLPRVELNYDTGIVMNIHYGDILVKYPSILNCDEEMLPFINEGANFNTSLLRNGDVIIADTAEDETVGKTIEIMNVGNRKIVSGLHTIPCRPKIHDQFAPMWLGYYLNSSSFHDQIVPYITGIKVSSISKGALSKLILAVPEKEEQKQIVEVINSMDLEIMSLKKKLEKYCSVRQGMMNELLTGRIRLV